MGASTIPHLSLPSEDEEEEAKSNHIWEYAINDLFKLSSLHAEGKSLRKCVKTQDMENIEHFFQWNEVNITLGRSSSIISGGSLR